MPSFPLLRRLLVFACALLPFSAFAGLEVKLVDAKGQPVVDAVISLVPLDAPMKLTPPAEPVVVTQHDQEFIPFVTPIMRGTRVSFLNNDQVQHHVYSQSAAKIFEIPLSGGQTKEPVLFDKAGTVAVGCNIHDWMAAYIVVLETPWFTQSDATGFAALKDAPPGRYRLEIWHDRLAKPDTRELTLTSAPGEPVHVTLVLKEPRRIRRHPVGAAGGGYK